MQNDFVTCTEIREGLAGNLTANLEPAWQVWGPYGGYVASVMLRAAGRCDALSRPTTMSVSFLRTPTIGEAELTVESLHRGRSVMAQSVELRQNDRRCARAHVWSGAEMRGWEHDDTKAPSVPPPDVLPTVELFKGFVPSAADVWRRLECRPVYAETSWPPEGPAAPTWRAWVRLREPVLTSDPWLHACRSLLLLDLIGWPAAVRPHSHDTDLMTPSIDMYAAFHEQEDLDAWLLCDGWAPVARHGVVHWRGQVWSQRGKLLGSGSGHCLYRERSKRS